MLCHAPSAVYITTRPGDCQILRKLIYFLHLKAFGPHYNACLTPINHSTYMINHGEGMIITSITVKPLKS